MNKFLISFSALLCLVQVATAGSDSFVFNNASVSTSATEIVTNMSTLTTAVKVSGEVESIFINFTSGAAWTGTVAFATTTAGPLGVARTIYSKSLSADDESPVRIPIESTSGAEFVGTNGYARIQLLSDVITMTTSSFIQPAITNISLNAYLILK